MSEIKRPEINALQTHVGSGLIHTDQTTKQPIVMRCTNPECLENQRPFDFISDDPTCPKCGMGAPAVQKRVLIHLLVPDPKGPIIGDLGRRFKLACDPMREYIATITNGEAGTGVPTEVNCPGCFNSKYFRSVLQKFQGGATSPGDLVEYLKQLGQPTRF